MEYQIAISLDNDDTAGLIVDASSLLLVHDNTTGCGLSQVSMDWIIGVEKAVLLCCCCCCI